MTWVIAATTFIAAVVVLAVWIARRIFNSYLPTPMEGGQIDHPVTCHSPAEHCFGCSHYWGESDVCEFHNEKGNRP